MLTPAARIFVALLLIFAAAIATYFSVNIIAAFAIILVGLVGWGYFKEGTVILAAQQYKSQKYEAANTLLKSIKNPKWLNKQRKPYYYLILGNIALQQLDYTTAQLHLGKAATMGLKANDLGTTLMHLANISLRNQHKTKGLYWIAEADKLPLTEKYKSILKNIKLELDKL
ncbi:MAG: tetratricopeptide repeat protein [Sphingobacteriales bacterium]|nr:MAG: tetratricopeptide repeat protein [Sphingobacteriales bacterium]TAF80200.1 MAG: tetratricopeptide repeat protein [Sphingobacteriales bacterium]